MELHILYLVCAVCNPTSPHDPRKDSGDTSEQDDMVAANNILSECICE